MIALTLPTAMPIERFRFTVEEYYRLTEVGILHEDSNVELIHGEIVRMAAIGRMHAGVVAFLEEHFHALPP